MKLIKREQERSTGAQAYEPQLSPLSFFDRFWNDSLLDPFNLLTPSLMRGRGLGGVSSAFPKVDVTETEKDIQVIANVPGIDPERLNIEVGDDYFSLSGTIEQERSSDHGKAYRYEREYGEFRREFSLPARVNKDGIVAKAKNGVLRITLPKSEDEMKKKVKVEVEH